MGYCILVTGLLLFSQLFKLKGAFEARCSLPYVSVWLLTVFASLFRRLSVPFSVAVQTQRIYCWTVFIPSVLYVLMYEYPRVSGLQVQVSLLKTCCRAAVLLARNGPQKTTTATTCHCWTMTSTPYASKWPGLRCQIVVLVLHTDIFWQLLWRNMDITFI